MALFLVYKLISIFFLKKDSTILPAVFISLILSCFGVYLWIKNGLIIDYGNPEEIITTHATLMLSIGIASVATGFIFIIIWMFKLRE